MQAQDVEVVNSHLKEISILLEAESIDEASVIAHVDSLYKKRDLQHSDTVYLKKIRLQLDEVPNGDYLGRHLYSLDVIYNMNVKNLNHLDEGLRDTVLAVIPLLNEQTPQDCLLKVRLVSIVTLSLISEGSFLLAQNVLNSLDSAAICAPVEKLIGVHTHLAYSSGDYKKALDYCEYLIESKKTIDPVVTYGNIGGLYHEHLDDTEKARLYFEKGITYYQEHKENLRARGYYRLLTSYVYSLIDEGDYKKAQTIMQEIKKDGIEVLDKHQFTLMEFEEGLFDKNESRYKDAIDKLEYVLEQADEEHFSLALRERVVNELIELYGHTGQIQKSKDVALYIASFFKKDSESVRNSLIHQYNAIYDIENKKRQVSTIQKEKQELELANIQHRLNIRNQQLIILGLMILSSFVVAFFYLRGRSRRKEKEQDIALKDEEMKQLLERQKVSNIKAHLNGQEDERKRIASELHDSVGSQLASLKYSLSHLKEHHEEQLLDKSIARVSSIATDIRNLSHDLGEGGMAEVDFIQLVDGYLNELDLPFEVNLSIQTRLDYLYLKEDVQLDVFRVLQEAINNIYKHAEASIVTIQIMYFDEDIYIMIEDNGKGGLEFNGFGIQSMNRRINRHGGRLEVDSSPNRGTIISVSLSAIEVLEKANV